MSYPRIAHIHVSDTMNKGDVAVVMAVREQLRKFFGRVNFEDFPIERLKIHSPEMIERINRCDIAVIGGGGIFYHYFLPFDQRSIDRIKIPIFLFSIGYNRGLGTKTMSDTETASIAHLAGRSIMIGVRDDNTKRFLVRQGVAGGKVRVIGDTAALLTEKEPLDRFRPNRPGIALNLNYSGWLGFGRWEKEIIGAYREVAGYFSRKYGATIYYALHHPDERMAISKLAIPNMKMIDRAPREQKFCYSRIDLMIGMMLHACIMAFGAGTPEINVGYDLKNRSFARFIHHPELAVDLRDLAHGSLLATAKRVYADRDRYRRQFAVKRTQIDNRHKEFIGEMKRLISR